MSWFGRQKPKPRVHPLDFPFFRWPSGDPFSVRHLLNGGILCLGRSGSGKTSSTGRVLGQVIANHPNSGGLVILPKPEDLDMWREIFRKAGRLNDLIVFDAEGDKRCNFFGCIKRPRDVVQFVITLSEVMKRGNSSGGGDNNKFYETQEERAIYNAVSALQAAKEPLTAPNLHRFIMTAGRTAEELNTAEWQAKYHSQVLDRGFKSEKTPLEAHDYHLCLDFWIKEWACLMDIKTRGNILAGVQGTMHIMNTGIVREMTSGEANCSPQDVLDGRWCIINFSPSAWGAAGLLISVGWKQLMELAILERKVDDASPFCVIWCDEAHAVTTAFDAVSFIPQCRSHKGALIYLTQSVSSFYAAMKGEQGKHQADALMSQFATVIAHSCDPVSAKWLTSKLGRKKQILYGGNSTRPPEYTVWDELYGQSGMTSSYSEHYEQVLQDQEFMVGRTGGPDNGYVCDAILIRSGEPFSDGKSYQRVVFPQR